MKNFLIAHIIVIILSIALSYFGIFMLKILCFILGGIVMLYGIIALLNTYVLTGVFDRFNNEYIVTNLEGNIWTLIFSFLFGAYIMTIPFLEGETALKLFLFVPAGILIWVLTKEFEKFEDDKLVSILDIVVIFLYLGTGVLYNLLLETEGVTQLCVIPISIGVLVHIFRTVYICKEYYL